jgi:hypothetical protein
VSRVSAASNLNEYSRLARYVSSAGAWSRFSRRTSARRASNRMPSFASETKSSSASTAPGVSCRRSSWVRAQRRSVSSGSLASGARTRTGVDQRPEVVGAQAPVGSASLSSGRTRGIDHSGEAGQDLRGGVAALAGVAQEDAPEVVHRGGAAEAVDRVDRGLADGHRGVLEQPAETVEAAALLEDERRLDGLLADGGLVVG